MKSLADYIESLLSDVMDAEPIKGPELTARLRARNAPAASDQSYRYAFTQLSKSSRSALQRVDGGQGYYYDPPTADSVADLKAEIVELRNALACITGHAAEALRTARAGEPQRDMLQSPALAGGRCDGWEEGGNRSR